VDRRGRVVGVQSGYLNSAKAPAMIAIAAPPSALRTLLDTRTSAETTTLGTRLDELWTQPRGFINRFPAGTQGVVTVVPRENGPVAKAGLNKESLITAIDGRPVAYVDDVMAAIRAKRPGDAVTLEVMEPDKPARRTVTVRLAPVRE
jgi:S1-C subfamily serine protease